MSPPSDNTPSCNWSDAPAGTHLQATDRGGSSTRLPGGDPPADVEHRGATVVSANGLESPPAEVSSRRVHLQRSSCDQVAVQDPPLQAEHDSDRAVVRNHAHTGLMNPMAHRDHVTPRVPSEDAIARVLAESDRLETAATRVLDAIGTGLGWDTGAVWCVDRAANDLKCLAAWTSPARQAPEFERICRSTTFSPGGGLAGGVWSSGRAVWVSDIRDDQTLPHVPMAAGEGLQSAVAVPIRAGEVLGVIEFFGRDLPQPDSALQQRLDALGDQFGRFIEQKRNERAALEHDIEMRLAQKIQQDLLPRTVPRFPGFKIGNLFRPAPETGGDYLDFVPLPDRSWVVAIGDASGHGVEAALLMAQTRAYLRALALGHTDVGKMLTLMNRRLVEDTLEEHYVTLFLARVLPESRSLVYSNAGHLPGFLLDAEGRLKKVLPCTGIPLGLDSNILYSKEAGIALQNGDRLLLFTDGISEARGADQSLFGVERAVKAVRSRLTEEPDVVAQSLLDEVLAFTGGQQADDQTVMLLQVERPA